MHYSKNIFIVFLGMLGGISAMEREERQPFPLNRQEQIVIEHFVTPRIRSIGNQILQGKISNDEGYAQLSRGEQPILEIYLKVMRRLEDYIPNKNLK